VTTAVFLKVPRAVITTTYTPPDQVLFPVSAHENTRCGQPLRWVNAWSQFVDRY